MKITILALGSRGDVQPMIALGMGLQAADYEIRLAADAIFETLVSNCGLEFFPIRYDMKKIFESEAGKAGLESGRNPISMIRNFAQVATPIIHQAGVDCCVACEGSDAIIYTAIGFFAAPSVAEKLKLPLIGAFLQPQDPTKAFPSPFSPFQHNLGNIFNRATQIIPDLILGSSFRSSINQWRQKQLNLPPFGITYLKQARSLKMPTLYGFSSNVVPKPSDWSNHIDITGYYFLKDSAWQAPNELIDFLEAGPPPVYVGFGSMNTRNPEETTNIVLEALARTKQRGLIVTGWGGLEKSNLPDNVFKMEYAPHDWLLPRTAAIVHHGGAGTTGASLQSGIPTIVVPFFYDQPFWGYRVAKLGVGPKPIPRKQLSVERLVTAITTAVTDNEMQKRAAALGERIRAEDGVSRAVKFIKHSLLNT